ncbi:hypothetical protein L1S32_03320 [Methanogenium sp. S4BF]|uniref:hypothetical protein n=1 Tax=Methanogenium sp. S4BF TaxID=1789226 RepID=UPI002416A3BA|nr:hypothetical protein [Methanogenium sp. S4BF]WFN35160.1 hypothetical protein L1S32_03320 [Methanogenium sp. S4BF]
MVAMKNADYFSAYILKIKTACPLPDEMAGHAIASMLIGHRMGLYDRAVAQGEKALLLLKEENTIPGALLQAVTIITSDAREKMPDQVTIKSSFDWEGQGPSHNGTTVISGDDTEYAFDTDSIQWLAVPLPEEKADIRDAYMLDTALMLLYGVAVCSSPMDEQAMEEHLYDYLIQRLGLYREEAEEAL